MHSFYYFLPLGQASSACSSITDFLPPSCACSAQIAPPRSRGRAPGGRAWCQPPPILLPLVFDVVWGRKGLISALQLHNPLPWCSSGFLWQESLRLLGLISSLLPACVRGRDPLRFHWDWDPGGEQTPWGHPRRGTATAAHAVPGTLSFSCHADFVFFFFLKKKEISKSSWIQTVSKVTGPEEGFVPCPPPFPPLHGDGRGTSAAGNPGRSGSLLLIPRCPCCQMLLPRLGAARIRSGPPRAPAMTRAGTSCAASLLLNKRLTPGSSARGERNGEACPRVPAEELS